MRNTLVIGIIGILLCCGGLARAELITIAISGQVTSVSDQYGHFGGQIAFGTPITGTYTYDLTTPDSHPSQDDGFYRHTNNPCGISLYAGGFNFMTDSTNVDFVVSLGKDHVLGENVYVLVSNHNLSLPNDTPVQYIYWQLGDSTGTALSNDSLPLTAPDLTKWNSNVLNISTDRNFGITATITSAVLIPEPCSILLLLAGGIVFRRQKRTR